MVLVPQIPAGLIELHINKKFQRPSENLDMEKESESTADSDILSSRTREVKLHVSVSGEVSSLDQRIGIL